MRVLCTGAAGFLGSILTGYLLEAGHAVTALDSFGHGQNSLAQYCANPKFDITKGDCRDMDVMKPLIAKADVIIPLAAIVGHAACDNDPRAAWTTNLDAIAELCDQVSRDQLIMQPTTNSMYGTTPPGEETDEDSPLKPLSIYGSTKIEAEARVMERENSISFRFATLFGMSPRHRADLLVNDFVWRAMRDRALVLFQADYRRNFVHVRDASTAFLHALYKWPEMRGKIYNCGDPRANMTKRALADKIATHLPDTVIMEAQTHSDPDRRDYLVNNSRLLNTGWMPTHSLDDGIRELIKGYAALRYNQYGNA